MHLAIAVHAVLPSASDNSVGALDSLISRLNTEPARAPVNASTTASRLPPHDLGVIVDRYSFDVRLFHPLLPAGLSRRTIRSTSTVEDERGLPRYMTAHGATRRVGEADRAMGRKRAERERVRQRDWRQGRHASSLEVVPRQA